MVIGYSQTINRFILLDAYPLPNIDNLVSKVAQYSVFSTLDLQSAYHQIPIRPKDKPFTAFEASGGLYQFWRILFGVTNGVAAFQRVIDQIIKETAAEDTYAYIDNVTVCGQTQAEHDRNLHRFMEAAERYSLTFNDDKCTFSTASVNLLGYTIADGEIRPDPERLKPLLALPVLTDMRSLRRILGMFAHYSKWIPRFSHEIHPLVDVHAFPLDAPAMKAFEDLK